MTNDTVRTFDAHAGHYDASRRRLVPCFDAFYGAAVDALGRNDGSVSRVLDLGAGTGLLSALVRAAHPAAALTLLDGSAAMLDGARERLAGAPDVTYVEGDLGDELPAGPWDAIVSALAIHHLDDDGKRALFARVHAALAPGGVFVNAEQVIGPTPAANAAYCERHEHEARALGTDDAEWTASLERQRHDRCATVDDQLAWLRAAGFTHAATSFEDGRFAVFVAQP